MFCIILLIVSIIVLCTRGIGKYSAFENKKSDLKPLGVVCAIVITLSAVSILIQGVVGTLEYPQLSSQLAKVDALELRIDDIRKSTYDYEKSGILVAGSIENTNQSTNLSKFIEELANKEAEYSGMLKNAKIHKEVFPLWFFGYGWYISYKIYDLRVIK